MSVRLPPKFCPTSSEPPIPTLPILETLKRVVVALAVDEAIAKSVVLVAPLAAAIVRFAYGVVVPTPTNPAEVIVVVPVEPKYEWLNTANGEVVAAAVAPLIVRKLKGDPPLPEPQAVPVFEIKPFVAKVAQPAEPAALVTIRLVVEAVPDTVSPPITVPSPIVVEASDSRPPENVSLVVVALLGNG